MFILLGPDVYLEAISLNYFLEISLYKGQDIKPRLNLYDRRSYLYYLEQLILPFFCSYIMGIKKATLEAECTSELPRKTRDSMHVPFQVSQCPTEKRQ